MSGDLRRLSLTTPAIVSRVMEGIAIKAGQLLPEGFFGRSPNLKPVNYDPELSKKLLAEAGYEKGLTIKGHMSNLTEWVALTEAVKNMLAPASQIEEVMGKAGIGNDALVLAYDDNRNMDAARLWFTLKAYGHDNAKVISGGLNALAAAGVAVTDVAASPLPVSFSAGPLRSEMFIDGKEVRAQVENPADNYVMIDTRSVEEFNEGSIPGSVCLDFSGNNFADSTFRPINQIRIRYLEQKIDYDNEVAMYCKTSIRGAQTYLVLYNAGYRNLKLYDGAWLDWTRNPMNPVHIPEGAELNLNAADQS